MGSRSAIRERRSFRAPAAVGAALGVAGMAAPVHGQFVFTDQTRRVYAGAEAANAFGGGSFFQQQFIAPNFGPFNATALAAAAGTIGSQADGRSEQVSSLLPGIISATGLTRVGSKMGSMSSVGMGSASWEFLVTFTLSEPTPVLVASSMHAVPPAGFASVQTDAWMEIKRSTQTGPVLLLAGQISAQNPAYSFSGPLLLEPGTHTVTLQAQSYLTDFAHTYQQAQINLGITITVVPSPTGTFVIATVLLYGAGRRRRSGRPLEAHTLT